MNVKKFNSEYGYSIILPENWSEYELEDEKNTNGFFDVSEWTGNLRITVLNIQVDRPIEFVRSQFIGIDCKELTWNNSKAFFYSEKADDLHIYYWYVIENMKIYLCSFAIDIEHKESEKNHVELLKVEKILKSLRTE